MYLAPRGVRTQQHLAPGKQCYPFLAAALHLCARPPCAEPSSSQFKWSFVSARATHSAATIGASFGSALRRCHVYRRVPPVTERNEGLLGRQYRQFSYSVRDENVASKTPRAWQRRRHDGRDCFVITLVSGTPHVSSVQLVGVLLALPSLRVVPGVFGNLSQVAPSAPGCLPPRPRRPVSPPGPRRYRSHRRAQTGGLHSALRAIHPDGCLSI
jgi:hypothetical protein